jgi:SAM-dependent methyltransferase
MSQCNTYQLGANSWSPPGQAAADEFMSYSKEYDSETTTAEYRKVTSSASAYFTGDKEGESVASLIKSRIETKTPAAFIRLGDADGNALFHSLGRYRNLSTYNLRRISQIYFGNEQLMEEHSDFMTDIILSALANADVIGAPGLETIQKSFETPYPDLDVRGMCGMRGVYNYLSGNFDLNQLKNACWCSTWYSRALLPHYFDLMRGLPFVGFVTCYPEIGPLVKARAGIRQIESIDVPMQASIAYQTKRAPNMRRDIGHFPEAYPAILDALRPPYQGALYIVAAGILSKSYCDIIKKRGGIAIDIGSIADVWMGTRSRPDMNQNMSQWSLLDSSEKKREEVLTPDSNRSVAGNMYNSSFYDDQRDGSVRTASIILPPLLEAFGSKSLIDVGCGVGTWAKIAKDAGVPKVIGIDGEYVEDSQLVIGPDDFLRADLENLGNVKVGKFDLAISVEVAEHLSPDKATQFIDFLTSTSDTVLFSAAIPGQGGVRHVNERWQSYWHGIFRRRGFECIDCIRSTFWSANAEPWYLQNSFIYTSNPDFVKSGLAKSDIFRNWTPMPVDVVHPELFSRRMKVGKRWLTINK